MTALPSSSGFGFSAGAASSSTPQATRLNAVLTQFQVGKRTTSNGPINSMDFNSKGDSLLYATDEPEESIHVFNVSSASSKKSVFCKKSGCDLVRFTHHTNGVLVASKNKAWDDTIRYLSLHDNKYLRYFKGHRDRVTSLSMNPRNDTFLSASFDRTMRLWDVRANQCQGLMSLGLPSNAKSNAQGGKVLVAHDPNGEVFAVASSPNLIKLFDSRSYENGPFVTFEIPLPPLPAAYSQPPSTPAPPSYFSWASLKFSPDGKDLLATTTEAHMWANSTEQTAGQNFTNRIFLLDSYEGQTKAQLQGHEFNPNDPAASPIANVGSNTPASTTSYSPAAANYQFLPFEASFSPDGAYIFAGSRSGSIHVWDSARGSPVAIWNGLNSTAPITAVQFCPTKQVLVSADCSGQLLWWIPAPKPSAPVSALSSSSQ